MTRYKVFFKLLILFSIFVGIFSGVSKALYNKGKEPSYVPTKEDVIQSLQKDVSQNVEYYIKGSPIEEELPYNFKENTEKGSQKEKIAMFLIDTSASMKTKNENKLAKVQESFTNALQYIGPNSYIGLISYSSEITVNVPISKFDETQARKLNGEVNNLTVSGGTHMYEAIALGISLIEDVKEEHPDAEAMLFVLSDGQPSQDAKKIDYVEETIKKLGIPIHTIGYGKDADKVELKKLAKINEATFTYVEKEDIFQTIKTLFDNNL